MATPLCDMDFNVLLEELPALGSVLRYTSPGAVYTFGVHDWFCALDMIVLSATSKNIVPATGERGGKVQLLSSLRAEITQRPHFFAEWERPFLDNAIRHWRTVFAVRFGQELDFLISAIEDGDGAVGRITEWISMRACTASVLAGAAPASLADSCWDLPLALERALGETRSDIQSFIARVKHVSLYSDGIISATDSAALKDLADVWKKQVEPAFTAAYMKTVPAHEPLERNMGASVRRVYLGNPLDARKIVELCPIRPIRAKEGRAHRRVYRAPLHELKSLGVVPRGVRKTRLVRGRELRAAP